MRRPWASLRGRRGSLRRGPVLHSPSRHGQLRRAPPSMASWRPGHGVPSESLTVRRPGRSCSIHPQYLSLRSTRGQIHTLPGPRLSLLHCVVAPVSTAVHSCPPYQTGCSSRTDPGLSSPCVPPPQPRAAQAQRRCWRRVCRGPSAELGRKAPTLCGGRWALHQGASGGGDPAPRGAQIRSELVGCLPPGARWEREQSPLGGGD